MPRIVLGTSYVDLVSSIGIGATARPDLFNLTPEPDETDVPVASPIEIKVVDVSIQGLAALTRVDVTTVGGGTVAAFIQGTGFHATYSGSTFALITSPGAGVVDEHAIQLVRATPYASQEIVTVRVRAQTNDGLILDRTYTFQIEDITLPILISAYTRGLTTLLLQFNEPVDTTSTLYSALRVREISGRVSFIAPEFIDAERAEFTPSSKDDYICITGSEQAINNSYFKIASIIDDTTVTTFEQTVATEEPLLVVQAWTGPYKLAAEMEPELLIPTFTPAIIAAELEGPSVIRLTLDQELSPNRSYTITAHNIQDIAEPANLQPTTTVAFTAEPLQQFTNRSFNLWDMIPQTNKRDDTSGDLQRLVRCLDEPVQLILSDVDRFGTLMDVDIAPVDSLDVHLANVGNPFTFVHDELLKRKTITNMVRLFKDTGIDRGIESAVAFFLSLTVDVQPFHLLDGWILGESFLGDDTVLGTDVLFLVYSFQIVSPVTLTQEQRDIITEIANVLKPAHTHFVRFVEP